MIPTKTLQKFNEIRALIFCQSPQVNERDGHIITLDERGMPDCIVARIASDISYAGICARIRKDPSKVQLVQWPHPANPEPLCIVDTQYTPHTILAFMLT